MLKEIGEVNNKFNKKILELKSLKNVANNELEIEENTNIEEDDPKIVEDNIKSKESKQKKYMIESQEILIIIIKIKHLINTLKNTLKKLLIKMDEEKEVNGSDEELDKESRQSLKSRLQLVR